MNVITEKAVQAVQEKSVDLEAQTPESQTPIPKPEEVADDHLVWYNSRHREGIFANYIPLYS